MRYPPYRGLSTTDANILVDPKRKAFARSIDAGSDIDWKPKLKDLLCPSTNFIPLFRRTSTSSILGSLDERHGVSLLRSIFR